MGQPAATSTAIIMCAFGLAPASLNVLPMSMVTIEGKPAATIADMMPMVNIPAFGMCNTLSNPTAAALGVLTPMPCVPIPAGPWKPGSPKTLIGKKPALTASSTCNCVWGGVITITFPGAVRTTV
jgi:hypothetical protein